MKGKNEKRIVSHIISLVLGIISIFGALFWYIGFPAGIISMILGASSYKRAGSKLGLAGLITGIIGFSLTTFIYVTFIILILLRSAF